MLVNINIKVRICQSWVVDNYFVNFANTLVIIDTWVMIVGNYFVADLLVVVDTLVVVSTLAVVGTLVVVVGTLVNVDTFLVVIEYESHMGLSNSFYF